MPTCGLLGTGSGRKRAPTPSDYRLTMSANVLSPAAQRRRAAPVQEAFEWGYREQLGWPVELEESLAFINALRRWLGMDDLRDEEP
jgi:hypothetical protein